MTPKEKKVGKNTYKIHYDGRIESRQRILKPQSNGHGYFYVSLGYGAEGYSNFYIHRLVAEAFIPNPNNLPEVNHLDGDKSNCAGWNLEWSTRQGNVDDYILKGRAKYPPLKPVMQFTLKGKYLKTWKSSGEIAIKFKCTSELIQQAAKPTNFNCLSAKKYIWIYKDDFDKGNKQKFLNKIQKYVK